MQQVVGLRSAAAAAACASGALLATRRSARCDANSNCTGSPFASTDKVHFTEREESQFIEVSQRRLADRLVDWNEPAYPRALRTLRQAYRLDFSQLPELMSHFVSEARKGLAGETRRVSLPRFPFVTHLSHATFRIAERDCFPVTRSSLAMIPTFVSSRVTGKERGDFFALDLGGTNFRVLRLSLDGNQKVGDVKQSKFTISEALKRGTGEELFGFVADCVARFLALECGGNPNGRLGFTFSFPVEQTAINAGKMLGWSKGFTTSGVVGQDVVAMLQTQFEERGINLRVMALANDTVGTMEAAAYAHPSTTMGIILGTGTNAAYIEQTSAVGKWRGKPSKEMVINTEWGNLNVATLMNEYDVALDAESTNPQRQTFEKMISGMYMGELVRKSILSPAVAAGMSDGCAAAFAEAFDTQGSFKTAYMSACEADDSPDLAAVGRLLSEAGVGTSTLRDRALLREACVCVSTRAARLSAMATAAVLEMSAAPTDATVAIDGSVFECYPYFKERMEAGLMAALGAERASRINLVLAKDGSGIGAAIIAALDG